MKNHLLLLGATLALLATGCTKHRPTTMQTRPAPQLPTLASTASDNNVTSDLNVSATPAAPVVRDFDQISALRDQLESIYAHWNYALADFQKQHSRLPGSLQELQQFRPKLASVQPPEDYRLNFDTQEREITVVQVKVASVAQSMVAPH